MLSRILKLVVTLRLSLPLFWNPKDIDYLHLTQCQAHLVLGPVSNFWAAAAPSGAQIPRLTTCYLYIVPKREVPLKGSRKEKGGRTAANQAKILNEGLVLTPITSQS